jgi:hypothetical protein
MTNANIFSVVATTNLKQEDNIMKLAKKILIIISYIMFTVLIIVGPEFQKYKLYVLLLQVLFFCTGPLLLVFIDWRKKRNKDKVEINGKSK